jgi:hypothetical protein
VQSYLMDAYMGYAESRVRDKSVSQSLAEVNISTNDLYRIKVIFSTD